MGPYALRRDLKHGPRFGRWLDLVSQWVCKDAEFLEDQTIHKFLDVD